MRAREAGFFFMDQIFLPRRFQRGIARPWGGSRSVFYSAGIRDPDRENGHYENIYIDALPFFVGSIFFSLKLLEKNRSNQSKKGF